MAYVKTETNLPRSLDVQISLSNPQTESRTDLSLMCLVAENLGLLPDATRIRFYSSKEAVEEDFAPGTEVYFAAQVFFSQTPRAPRMAIAEAFLAPQPARLVSGVLSAADIDVLKEVVDGSMKVAVNGVATDVTGMDFSDALDEADIAAVIDAALAAANVAAQAEVMVLPGGEKRVVIVSNAVGDAAAIAFPIEAAEGTFIAPLLLMSAVKNGRVLQGYTAGNLDGELTNITAAANANGEFVYGWCFGASLRDVSVQTVLAAWALSHTAIMGLTTNDLTALDPGTTTDLGSVLNDLSNRRVAAFYHDNPQEYPDVSLMAFMLSVNYQMQDSTVTAKFKKLPGVSTVNLTETEWAVLKSKGYNVYTATGNTAKVVREGGTEDANWFIDTTINLDNFVEDLSVSVYNVFLRNNKVPYTRRGQAMIVQACKDVGFQYQYNGTFADRQVLDTRRKAGTKLVPAVVVVSTPIELMSAADRAGRIGPPVQLVVQEAGAIHSIAINVNVVN